MTYFDHSATSFVNKDVLKEFKDFFNITGTNEMFDCEKNKISNIFDSNLDVIFTSGSTESNNLAIKGITYNCECGSHIITTKLEHSSINETLKHLEKKGFIIDYVKLKNGIVDLVDLEKLLCDKTVLVSICSVSSEIGNLQPINEIGLLLKKYSNVIFHSDMTQSIGKINIPLDNVDLISFSAHKFNGIKGTGCLLKRKNVFLHPLLFGERTYNYALIKSMVKALEISYSNLNKNYDYVLNLNNKLKEGLSIIEGISINSNSNCIPFILNISVKNYKPETFVHLLEQFDMYISTKSACSFNNDYSHMVYAFTNNMEKAKTSVRISLSFLNTMEDVNNLLKIFEHVKL